MPGAAERRWVHVGRTIDGAELELIQETVELLPSLSLHELASTLCDLLGWYLATGTRKWQACHGYDRGSYAWSEGGNWGRKGKGRRTIAS